MLVFKTVQVQSGRAPIDHTLLTPTQAFPYLNGTVHTYLA